ncbi:hypothetical protein, partial [Kitasatospora sp. NPDC093102]|uniref:hypothetical protein n=1 Tax=Kitasatospora sp. NPDC093102 TaxID=3155069 RepID=UPI003441EDF3
MTAGAGVAAGVRLTTGDGRRALAALKEWNGSRAHRGLPEVLIPHEPMDTVVEQLANRVLLSKTKARQARFGSITVATGVLDNCRKAWTAPDRTGTTAWQRIQAVIPGLPDLTTDHATTTPTPRGTRKPTTATGTTPTPPAPSPHTETPAATNAAPVPPTPVRPPRKATGRRMVTDPSGLRVPAPRPADSALPAGSVFAATPAAHAARTGPGTAPTPRATSHHHAPDPTPDPVPTSPHSDRDGTPPRTPDHNTDHNTNADTDPIDGRDGDGDPTTPVTTHAGDRDDMARDPTGVEELLAATHAHTTDATDATDATDVDTTTTPTATPSGDRDDMALDPTGVEELLAAAHAAHAHGTDGIEDGDPTGPTAPTDTADGRPTEEEDAVDWGFWFLDESDPTTPSPTGLTPPHEDAATTGHGRPQPDPYRLTETPTPDASHSPIPMTWETDSNDHTGHHDPTTPTATHTRNHDDTAAHAGDRDDMALDPTGIEELLAATHAHTTDTTEGVEGTVPTAPTATHTDTTTDREDTTEPLSGDRTPWPPEAFDDDTTAATGGTGENEDTPRITPEDLTGTIHLLDL